MKKKILFVDDEVVVLQVLKSVMREQQENWELAFAESGMRALEMMQQEHFDAIITDMNMPGMDGIELLAEVKNRHPASVRLILSDHSNVEMVMRSVGTSHQILSKPCDPLKLKTALIDAFGLRDTLSSSALQQLVSGMTSLPSLPMIYQKITEAVQSDHASIAHIGALIEQDIGLTTKILQLANSAYFGLCHQISSPAEAAKFLGMDVLRGLVLANGVFSQFDEELVNKMSLYNMIDRSIAVADAARQIVNLEQGSDLAADQAFLGGMMHDLGSLILATNTPEKYFETLQYAAKNNLPMVEAEYLVFGTSHAEVGAYMLGLWGIDEVVVAAVAYHHKPFDFPCFKFTSLTAVYVAATLITDAATTACGVPVEELIEGKALEYIENMGKVDRLPLWCSACERRGEQAA